EKLERVEVPGKKRRAMKLWFPSPPRPGRVVVELEGVDFSYGDVHVYRDLTVAIERGQRVALVGPNGAGKSTLLKLIAGALEVDAGRVRSYEGDYELYRYRKEREADGQTVSSPSGSDGRGQAPPREDPAKARRRESARDRVVRGEQRAAVRRVERELDRETA